MTNSLEQTAQEPMVKIDDDNMQEFNRYTKAKGRVDARNIYQNVFAGDLATLGREKSRASGYPFGSVTPFIIDHTGSPVIYTANVAEHTKNALDNGKASLMMRQVEKQHRIETGWRLTCAGDLVEVTGADRNRVAETYFRFYPEAKTYGNVHDFYFFRLNIAVARVIMGFGKISWVEGSDLMIPSTLSAEQETHIIEHMNEDHSDAIVHYLNQIDVDVDTAAKKKPKMVSVNQFGATIDYRHHLYFLAFSEVANDSMAIREQLVKLAKS